MILHGMELCAEKMGDPFVWYGLDSRQKTQLLAMHRVRHSDPVDDGGGASDMQGVAEMFGGASG